MTPSRVVLLLALALSLGCSDKPAGPSKVRTSSPQSGAVRFVALGDAGEGNDAQYAIASAIGSVCAARGCDFALYMGDNFYNDGVETVDDSQFEEKFELPYADLDFPFYVALGNHDYGGNGLGNMRDKPDPQVAYTEHSEKWTLPDRYHAFDATHVRFLALDTNAVLWSSVWETADAQIEWLRQTTTETNHPWRIAFGHHPYISNGQHGSAGNYEGLSGIPIISGDDLKALFDEEICGTVDVYLSGHDHDMQWLEPTCGTHFIVSGAGAKTRRIEGWDHPTRFEVGETLGFLWAEIVDDTFHGVFFGSDGEVLYDDRFTRG